MLESIKTYFQKMMNGRFVRGESKTSSGMCCIDLSPAAFSIAYAKKENGKPHLLHYASDSYTSLDELQKSLTTLAKSYPLETADCTWILQPEQYQLLSIDALPVPANEFQAAVRWKIKELVRFPIEDVVIDHFPLPIKKGATAQESIMLVIAKASELAKTSEQLQQSGLNLNTISIPEISLRNIAVLFDQEDKATALLYLQEKNSQLVITCKQQLHFMRRIELGIEFLFPSSNKEVTEAEAAEKMDRLALETQRSFDYYQSQWRQPLPSRIVFASVKKLPLDVAPLLAQRLSMPVEWLDLNRFLGNGPAISREDQGNYLLTLGSLLHQEGEAYAAKN